MEQFSIEKDVTPEVFFSAHWMSHPSHESLLEVERFSLARQRAGVEHGVHFRGRRSDGVDRPIAGASSCENARGEAATRYHWQSLDQLICVPMRTDCIALIARHTKYASRPFPPLGT